jgi:hypothetical protein
MLTATSTVVNTGRTAVKLTSRTCYFFDDDFESNAQLTRFEPLMSCAAVSMTGELAPGQSIPVLQVQFGVTSLPGTYTLGLRHALSPEFRGKATFTIR